MALPLKAKMKCGYRRALLATDDRILASKSKSYTQEQKDLKAEVISLQQVIEEQERQAENLEQFIQRVKRNSDLTELTPYALRELVKAVYMVL